MAMGAEKSTQSDVERLANPEDIRHVLGETDQSIVVEILSNKPSFRELTDAAIWARGDGDLIAREHAELSAVALAIAEILTREEDETIDEGA